MNKTLVYRIKALVSPGQIKTDARGSSKEGGNSPPTERSKRSERASKVSQKSKGSARSEDPPNSQRRGRNSKDSETLLNSEPKQVQVWGYTGAKSWKPNGISTLLAEHCEQAFKRSKLPDIGSLVSLSSFNVQLNSSFFCRWPSSHAGHPKRSCGFYHALGSIGF